MYDNTRLYSGRVISTSIALPIPIDTITQFKSKR